MTDEQKKIIEETLDKLLIGRGEHPTRVRNPLYSEERQLAKDLVEFALDNLDGWVKTRDQKPTIKDSGGFGNVISWDGQSAFSQTISYLIVRDSPELYIYWQPLPSPPSKTKEA